MVDRGRRRAWWVIGLVAAALVSSCDRSKDNPAADAGADAGADPGAGPGAGADTGPGADADAGPDTDTDAGPDTDTDAGADTDAPAAAPAAEARRSRVQRLADTPLLAPHRDALTAHYGEKPPLPLDLQVAALPGGRQALLILGPPEAREPLVLVLDPGGARAWTKERPLAGIVPGVRELAILGAPEGGVALALCDPEGTRVAMRHWDAAGGIFADYELVEVEGCAALSAVHWPGQGFVAAAAGGHGAWAQRLDSNGGRAWGRAGLRLPWRSAEDAPVTIAPTGDAVVLLQAGAPEAEGARPGATSILAMRYDPRGNALWRAPVTVGAAPAQAGARVVATPARSGAVRVQIGGRVIELSAEGRVGPPGR